ncbi:hypothetical protein EAH72_34585 [Pseudomonas caspiana]|nr:hypothetical protein [Pseudomonas caspiana]TPG86707.1 hypothetical protein EAH72_34585 [Pseudomonas caspiana]
MKTATTRRQKILFVGLAIFLVAGWIQQKYAKQRAQADYESHCAAIAKDPARMPCVTPTPPDIPLPAQG